MTLPLKTSEAVEKYRKAHPWNIQLSHRCASAHAAAVFGYGPATCLSPDIACSVCTVDPAPRRTGM